MIKRTVPVTPCVLERKIITRTVPVILLKVLECKVRVPVTPLPIPADSNCSDSWENHFVFQEESIIQIPGGH